jgi:superfamily II DNA/RNA helicase
MLCLSETGSGKTLSFLLPIINSMHKLEPSELLPGYALIMCPTRELCIQINEYLIRFREHGLSYCTSVVLHGGSDTKMRQVI